MALDKIESIYIARFVFLPVIEGPTGIQIDIPTNQALGYLNQTLNDNDFEFSIETAEDGTKTTFTGVPKSLLTSDDGITFTPT